MAELGSVGDVVSRFVYGSKANVPDYLIRGSDTLRVISDHLGPVRMVVDASDGSVVQELSYDAWGRVLEDTNPGYQPFGLAGGIWDGDVGLVRFGVRDYDAVAGRWTAKDPIGLAGGFNVFGYVGGDPVNSVDPSGLCEPDDTVCQSFVTMFRMYSREAGDTFDQVACALDAWRGGRIEFWSSHRFGDAPGETTYGQSPWPEVGRFNLRLNGEQAPGEMLITLAHEVMHIRPGSPKPHNDNAGREFFYNVELDIARGLPAAYRGTMGHYQQSLSEDYRRLRNAGIDVRPPTGF